MDNHIDKETSDALLKALSSAQDYSRQLQAKQEKSIFYYWLLLLFHNIIVLG